MVMTRENTLKAAHETLLLADQHILRSLFEKPDAGMAHLEDMHRRMVDDETMNEGKLGRWLGWMQACVYLQCPGVSLDDMKAINMRNSVEIR